jgi:hypothetical protein
MEVGELFLEILAEKPLSKVFVKVGIRRHLHFSSHV